MSIRFRKINTSIMLLILIFATNSMANGTQTNTNFEISAVARLKSSMQKKSFSSLMKPLSPVQSITKVKLTAKPQFLSKSKYSLQEKNSPEKNEKPVYIRYLLPVVITIGAGTATYMLYSVRSN